MKKNILLTGSGGFIGSNIKKNFKDKYQLLTPRSFELDLCNKKAVYNYFQNNNIYFVIHCATNGGVRGIPDNSTTLKNNLDMVHNIIKAKKDNTRIQCVCEQL